MNRLAKTLSDHPQPKNFQSQGTRLLQIQDLCRTKANNIKFNYRTNPEKKSTAAVDPWLFKVEDVD